MRRLPLWIGLVGLLLLAAALLWLLGLGRPTRPNIILVSIDTLRSDHLHCYGYPRSTSPHLDALAQEGVLFENMVSTTSWTLPAHASLFTGLPDSVHGVTDIDRWLDGSRITLAERLQDAGYATAGFFSGPFLHPGYGFSQGFDTYVDCTAYGDRVMQAQSIGDALKLMHGGASKDITNDRVRERVTAWLEQRHAGPFFLFVHMWDCHYDYIPPSPFDRMFGESYDGPVTGRDIGKFEAPEGGFKPRDIQRLKDLYDGEIAWTDHTVGKILDVVERLGLAGNTIVAVTSDHGEEFFEHGGLTHRNSLHEEVVRVPLIIRRPGGIEAGVRVRHQASIYDVAPTLLELAGLRPLEVAWGHSLARVMEDALAAPPTEVAVGELLAANTGYYFFSLRHLDWKLIIDWKTRSHRVYDLRRDPGEQQPLAESAYPMPPGEFEALYRDTARRMQEMAARLPRPDERDTPMIPAVTREQLRSLGYLR